MRGFRVGLHTQNSVKQIHDAKLLSSLREDHSNWQMPTAPYSRLKEGQRAAKSSDSVSVNSYCISSGLVLVLNEENKDV